MKDKFLHNLIMGLIITFIIPAAFCTTDSIELLIASKEAALIAIGAAMLLSERREQIMSGRKSRDESI